MSKFSVTAMRVSAGSCDFEVEAPNMLEARKLALERVGNFVYKEYHADYSLESVVQIPDDAPTDPVDSEE